MFFSLITHMRNMLHRIKSYIFPEVPLRGTAVRFCVQGRALKSALVSRLGGCVAENDTALLMFGLFKLLEMSEAVPVKPGSCGLICRCVFAILPMRDLSLCV